MFVFSVLYQSKVRGKLRILYVSRLIRIYNERNESQTEAFDPFFVTGQFRMLDSTTMDKDNLRLLFCI